MAMASSDDQLWVDPVAIDIDSALAGDKLKFESTRRLNPSVFRVPPYVRKLKPDVYEASLLPMGLLYYRRVKGMSSIYQLKLEVLGCFLELLKVDKDRWKTFCEDIATQPPDSDTPYLAHFYENDGTYTLPTLESLQSLLITDAFFIVGLFIWSPGSETDSEPEEESEPDEQPRFIKRIKQIFYRGSLGSSVHALDLDICWLYGGQIPLFLVKNAWEKVANVCRSALEIGSFTAALKKNLFRTMMYSGVAFDVQSCEESDFKTCDHLLACVHKAISLKDEEDEEDEEESSESSEDDDSKDKEDEENVKDEKDEENYLNGEEEKAKSENTEEPEQEEGRFKSYIHKLPIGRQILKVVEKLATSMSELLHPSDDHYTRLTLPSATQLATTGVRFKCHDGLTNEVRFDKSFFRMSATLYLARIYVADFTETMLLNMCVYESMNREDEGVHNCVMLMDELIDTEEDVELLMDGRDPIITENRLGDNKQVVGIFTNPVQNLYFVKGDSYRGYGDVRDEMISWYNNPWRRRVFQFLDSYRVAPWLLVSLLAAVFLLVLTVLQTIYTVWGFYRT